jgi:Skp family chaperone for outer membrane proteins
MREVQTGSTLSFRRQTIPCGRFALTSSSRVAKPRNLLDGGRNDSARRRVSGRRNGRRSVPTQREEGNVKKLSFAIAGLAAMGGLLFMNARALAQNNGVQQTGGNAASAPPQPAAPATKIGVINILKVVKEFKKADSLGAQILNDAKKYEFDLNNEKEALKQRDLAVRAMPDGPQKDQETKTLRERINHLQDNDQAAQKDIRARRDKMAIDINKDIQTVIDTLARQYGFEMILTYPDVTEEKEKNTIGDAMRRITTPGTMIAWHDHRLDVTDECIRYLNYYFKATEGSAPAAPAATAPANGQQPR